VADTSADKQLKQVRLQDRRDRAVSEIRIWDLLAELGIKEDESYKGKLHCIFPGHDEKTPSMKIYPETDSVFCFGCGGSGDVVEVARRCAGDKAWSPERAIEWLEQRFGIEPLPEIVTFAERLKSKLGAWREAEATSESVDPALLSARLTDQMAELLVGVSPEIKVALIPVEDYIWEEFERPGVDYHIWYSWASKMISGYYNRFIADMQDFLGSPEYVVGRAEVEFEAGLLADDHFADEKMGSP
jgi:hypothetical protein